MIIIMRLSYVDWVELESLVSQQRTVVYIKLSHFRTYIIMGVSLMWIGWSLRVLISLPTKYDGAHKMSHFRTYNNYGSLLCGVGGA